VGGWKSSLVDRLSEATDLYYDAVMMRNCKGGG
jgi:hypothetical protein